MGKTCPKCTTNGAPTRMHHHVTTLGANSLERYADSDIYSGYTCHSCGTWIDDELVVVKPGVPLPDPKLVRPSGKRVNPATYKHRIKVGEKYREEVRKRIDRINELRQQGISWPRLVEFLKKEDFKISYTCLRLHYYAIVGKEQKAA